MATVRRQTTTVQAAAAFSVMAAVLAGAAWLLWPASDRRVVLAPELAAAANPVTLDDGLALKPVDMPVALLFDCYENALENVPPRTDTSKRQWSWEAPPLPMDVARRELGKPGASENDRKVLAWLEGWEEGWRKDYPTTTDQLWNLEAVLAETRMSSEPLFNVGLAMSFLDGDEQAALWQRTAIGKLSMELAAIRGDSQRTQICLQNLGRTRALWQVKDHQALEKRFRIERDEYPRLSKESRKSGHLIAEMQMYQDLHRNALAQIRVVDEENRKVGDLSTSDKSEMDWVVGSLCYATGQSDEAIERLGSLARAHDATHGMAAHRLLVITLARRLRISDAEAQFDQFRDTYHPRAEEALSMIEAIGAAKAVSVRE